VLCLQGELGELALGAAADLLLVEGDPLEDIAVLTNPNNIRLVIKAGLLAKVGASRGGGGLPTMRQPVPQVAGSWGSWGLAACVCVGGGGEWCGGYVFAV